MAYRTLLNKSKKILSTISRCCSERRAFTCEPLETRRLLALTVPAYNSLPGAFVKVFLDFDGSAPFSWTNSEGTFTVHGPGNNSTPCPGFSLDADANNFNSYELTAIQQIWQWVSEKYSPFRVNVTTADPGNQNDNETVRVLIGGSNSDWYTGKGGGVAAIGGFQNAGLGNTAFAWTIGQITQTNTGMATVDRQFVAETCAHESGHEFGLVHERYPSGDPTKPNEYYPGDSIRAPIMGGSSNNTSARGIWWKTNNFAGQNSPDSVQDELNVLAGSGGPLTYRTDDFSYTSPGILQVLSDGTVSNPPSGANGVIENTSDFDPLQFTAQSARVTFRIDNAQFGGMLAPNVSLIRVSNFQVVPSTVTTSNTSVSITTDQLSPGAQYYLNVFGQGNYGDIGQYRVSGAFQNFATYDPVLRTVNVGGINGNNRLTISVQYNGAGDPGLLTISSTAPGNTGIQQFSMAGLIMVKVTLGNGSDVLDIQNLRPLYGGGNGLPVRVDLGGGTDTLILDGYNDSTCTFDVQNNAQMTFFTTPVTITGGVEAVQMLGTIGVDNFNIHDWGYGRTLSAVGYNNSDVMTLDFNVINSLGSAITFDGGVDTDTLVMNAGTATAGVNFTVYEWFTDWAVLTFATGGQRETHFASTVEQLSLIGGSGNNFFGVDGLPGATTAYCYGGSANDTLEVGFVDLGGGIPFSDYMHGSIAFSGGAGYDSVFANDQSSISGHAYTVYPSYFYSNTSGVISYGLTTTEYVGITGPDNYAATFSVGPAGTSGAVPTTLIGGAQGDAFTLTNSMWPSITLDGGAGIDSMTIDDRTGITPVWRSELYPQVLYRDFGSSAQFSTRLALLYSNIESPSYYVNDGANRVADTFNIYGVTLANPGYQWTFLGNSLGDAFTVYPHDAFGNLTINGLVGVIAGAGFDTFAINDIASTKPINYSFSNPYGASTQDIYGMGTGVIGEYWDIEASNIYAGGGNDTFAINQYQSGISLGIYGGNGNDFVNFGNSNLPTYVTSISAFGFDGQGGSDTFAINNSNESGGGIYTRANNSITFTRSSPTSYGISLSDANVEAMNVYGGTGWDAFYVDSALAGCTTTFYASAGLDNLILGSAGNTLENIHAPLVYDAGASTGGNVTVYDTGDTTGDIVHLTSGSLGAFPGDTLFGAGGTLTYTNVTDYVGYPGITLNLGSGADTVYAQPLAGGHVTINANNPTSGSGDSLGLALAGVTAPAVNNTGGGSGNVTSSNRQTLNWTGIETGPATDAVSPAAQSQSLNVDGIVVGSLRRQSVDVQFSEPVSLLNGAGSIQLTNTTTGQTIPAGDILLSYDSPTRTAHFTFPNYPNGVLPDGDYAGTVIAGRTADTFGNPLPADVPFTFFVLTADANHNRTVDTVDFNIVAANFSQTGRTFSQGDFNYDGKTDTIDFNLLASNFSKNLAPAPAAAPQAAAQAPVVLSAEGAATLTNSTNRQTQLGDDQPEYWRIDALL